MTAPELGLAQERRDRQTETERERRPARTRVALFGLTCEVATLRAVLGAWALSRLVIFFIIFVSSVTIPMRPGAALFSNPDNLILDGLVRDDSWWYYNIATRGYTLGSVATGEQGTVAFFPLYPLLVKTVAGLTGDVFLAGIIVANVAFVIALFYLHALARREIGDGAAGRAVFYFAAAPTAVFFSAMYTESLFLALLLATLYYARAGSWDRAALAGMLASATRNTGVVLAGVVALEALHAAGVRFWPTERPEGWSREALARFCWRHLRRQAPLALRAWPGLVAAALVPLGLIAYMAYLSNTFGDPLAFIHVQATWGREAAGSGITQLVGNTMKLLRTGPNPLAGQVGAKTLLDTVATLAFLPLVLATPFKLRPGYALLAIATFLVPLSTGSVGSMTRYILMLVPCFLLLARWGEREWVDRLVLGLSLPMLAYFTVLFSHWYFAG